MSTKIPALLAVASICLVALAVVPDASAHYCRAQDPKNNCGDCKIGTHDHNYNDGTNWCESSCMDNVDEVTVPDFLVTTIERACASLNPALP